MWKEVIEMNSCKLLVDAFQFVGMSTDVCNRVPSSRNVFKLRSYCGKYNRSRYLRDKKEKIMLQTRPSNFRHSENV
jgi:hypothetical protein